MLRCRYARFAGGVASLVWAPSIGGVAAGAGTLLATAALRTAVAVYEDAAWTGGPVRGLAAPAAAAAATPSGTILLALRGIADLGVLGGGATAAVGRTGEGEGGGSLRLVAPAVRLAVDDGGNRLAAIAADGTVTLYALGGAGGEAGSPCGSCRLARLRGAMGWWRRPGVPPTRRRRGGVGRAVGFGGAVVCAAGV
ncbi:hypothetical protein MMPV_003791 [Pyropia vietnamensis]